MLPRVGSPVAGSIGIQRAVGAPRHVRAVPDLIGAGRARGPHDPIRQVLIEREGRILLRPRPVQRHRAGRERDFLFAQERVVAEHGVDERRRRPVEEDPVAAADHPLVAVARRPGKPQARRDVVPVLALERVVVVRLLRGGNRGVDRREARVLHVLRDDERVRRGSRCS